MNPLYVKIVMTILEDLPLSEDLRELEDENLMDFIQENRIMEYLWENNIITSQGDFYVLKNKKDKTLNLENYWDSVKKYIDINGQTVDEWNKNMRGRWTCYSSNLNQIGTLLKKGFTFETIGKTLSYIAMRDGQYTQKLTLQFDPLVFKQNFEKKDLETTINKSWNT